MGHVLKANRVQLGAPVRLSIDGTDTPTHAGSRRPGIQPRVRIVESNAQFAVLEVTCACGAVTHVRCEYQARNAVPVPQGPAQS
jgi:hypothetical protein